MPAERTRAPAANEVGFLDGSRRRPSRTYGRVSNLRQSQSFRRYKALDSMGLVGVELCSNMRYIVYFASLANNRAQ